MVTKRQVLEFIARRTEIEMETSYRSVVRHFRLSVEAACAHLGRLWHEHLIEATTARRRGFWFKLEPGETICDLSFWLTVRGANRLDWYAVCDEGNQPQ
jgi:hypothetical protein